MWSVPADGARIGGDWCESVEISNDVVALTIGDIAGHGEPAAETMRAVRASVLHALAFMRTPSDALAAANACLIQRNDEVIATAVVAFYDRSRRTITYANAGHPPPLLVIRGSTSFLCASRADIPLGVYAHHHAQNYTVALPPSALVVFYTDGVTERDRDPIRGEADLASAGLLAYGLEESDYARAIAERVFESGLGHDDAAVLTLHTALAAIRHERDARGQNSRERDLS